MDDATLTIGQLARRFGLKTSAIRYYEANGILPEPNRESGQRRYDAKAVRRMEVLDVAKRAVSRSTKRASCSEALRPARRHSSHCAATRKLPEVEALIARAQAVRQWLLTATDCSCTSLDVCALFEPGADHTPQAGNPSASTSQDVCRGWGEKDPPKP